MVLAEREILRAGAQARLGREYDIYANAARRIRPRTSGFAAGMFFYGAVALLVVALGVGYVAQRAEIVKADYARMALQAEIRDLETTYDRLSLEYARLSSPERIEKVAIEKLGMVHPGEVQVVVVPGARAAAKEETAKVERPAGVEGPGRGLGDIMLAALSQLVATWFHEVPETVSPVLE